MKKKHFRANFYFFNVSQIANPIKIPKNRQKLENKTFQNKFLFFLFLFEIANLIENLTH